MANRQTPSRQAGQKGARLEKSTSGRRVQSNTQPEEQTRTRTQTQEAPKRNDVVECKQCGEFYSVTYRNCPFCNERPGRSAGARKKNVHPVQLIGLIVSMVLIISALFIVFKYVGPLIFGEKDPVSPSVSTSQSGSQSGGDVSQPDPAGSQESSSSQGGSDVPDVPPAVEATHLKLDKTDITLVAGEVFQFTPSVLPSDAAITWTSSDESILQVAQDGTVTNVNTTGSKVKVTVTATSCGQSSQCTVYCNSKGGSSSGQQTGGEGQSQQPSGGTTNIPAGSRAVISVSGSGLNIRSGPGSSYDKIASAANGAEVTILGAENGWYKIDYGNGKVGYVSGEYVKAK